MGIDDLPIGTKFSMNVIVNGKKILRQFVVTEHWISGLKVRPIDGRREIPL